MIKKFSICNDSKIHGYHNLYNKLLDFVFNVNFLRNKHKYIKTATKFGHLRFNQIVNLQIRL